MNEEVEHIGTIVKINGESITIAINDDTSCVSCSLNNVCKPHQSEVRELKVYIEKGAEQFCEKEKVKIIGSVKLRKSAILIATFYPCLILVVTIFVAINLFNFSESISALLSLFILSIYYLIMYHKRKTLMRRFSLIIKKL